MKQRRKFKHRRFADGAGFTRHCWECANAVEWDGANGRCSVHDMAVSRYDNPNNICSKACCCYSYRELGIEVDES